MRNLVNYFEELTFGCGDPTKDYDDSRDGDFYQFYKKRYEKLAESERAKKETLITIIKDILMPTTLTDLKLELQKNLPTKKSAYPIHDIREMLAKLDYQNLFNLYFMLHKFGKNENKLKNRLLKIFHEYLTTELAEKMVELAASKWRHFRYITDRNWYFDNAVPYQKEIAETIKVLAANIPNAVPKTNEVPRSSRFNNVITFFGTKSSTLSQKSNDNFESALDFISNP